MELHAGRSESCPALKKYRTNFARRFGEMGEYIGVGGDGRFKDRMIHTLSKKTSQ
jgi:hypothetical protein